jgi:hypothetical protein
MATNTYVALQTTTVSSPTSSIAISLSGITGYTDLVLVGNAKAATNASLTLSFNGDSGSNYSYQVVDSDGTTASANRQSNTTAIQLVSWSIGMGSTTNWSSFTANINNFSNNNVFKPVLVRSAVVNASNAMGSDLFSGVWRNTNAITSMTIAGNTIAVGSTFSLYGVASAGATNAKATGGIISSDDTYWYHAFTSTGVFTPLAPLTADILTIAGGGAGGRYYGGGGGAGGLVYSASQSLTATNYTCTIGAGGAGATGALNGARGNNGTNSQFASLTAAVGGGGGATTSTNNTGASGGSGGGGTYSGGTGGAGTSGQGSTGGNTTAAAYGGAGGGGAGGVGGDFTVNGGANQSYGGVGSTTYSSWGLATGTGQYVGGTVYYAGGGAGNPQANNGVGGYGGGGSALNLIYGFATAGMPATGGGGSNTGGTGTSGGSGIIIVRYAKV